jgi:hypothetical protein
MVMLSRITLSAYPAAQLFVAACVADEHGVAWTRPSGRCKKPGFSWPDREGVSWLLPDFPEFKKNFSLALENVLTLMVESGPLLRMVKRTRHFEGSRHGLASQQQTNQRHYKQLEALAVVSHKEIAEGGPERFLERAAEAGAEMQSQAEKHLVQLIDEAASQGIHGFKTPAEAFTPGALLDAMESADVTFDEKGRHNWSLIVHPSAVGVAKKCLREIAENPEYEQRARSILEQKYRDWICRKNNRSVVD